MGFSLPSVGKFLPLVGAGTVGLLGPDELAALGAGAAVSGNAIGSKLGGVSALNGAQSNGNLNRTASPYANDPYVQAPAARNGYTSNQYSGTSSGGGGGSAAPSGPTLQEAQSQVQNALNAYNANYANQNAALQTQFNDAQTAHDQAIAQNQDYYNTQQHNLDQGKANQDSQLLNVMAGHGVGPGDSAYEYYQNQNNQSYQQQVAALHQDQISKLQAADQALQTAKNNLNLQRQNLDLSQFNNVNQLQQYLAQIDSANAQLDAQAKQIQAAIANSKNSIQSLYANPSNAYTSAQAQQSMIDQINKMIAAGTTKQAIQGFIKQGANKDELQSLLDYYQNVSNTGGPQAPVAPAAT